LLILHGVTIAQDLSGEANALASFVSQESQIQILWTGLSVVEDIADAILHQIPVEYKNLVNRVVSHRIVLTSWP
jgi:hypothetical protein